MRSDGYILRYILSLSINENLVIISCVHLNIIRKQAIVSNYYFASFTRVEQGCLLLACVDNCVFSDDQSVSWGIYIYAQTTQYAIILDCNIVVSAINGKYTMSKDDIITKNNIVTSSFDIKFTISKDDIITKNDFVTFTFCSI